MNVMHSRCAGLDVHKESISACVLIASNGKKKAIRVERQTVGTFTDDLQQLKQWLQQWRVTHVALESTGILEAGMEHSPGWRLRNDSSQPATLPLGART